MLFSYTAMSAQKAKVIVNPVSGTSFSDTRNYQFTFTGVFPPAMVTLNGDTISYVSDAEGVSEGSSPLAFISYLLRLDVRWNHSHSSSLELY